MVDISTAMAAASVDGKRRGGKDSDKKGKSGRNLGIESFDPVKYVAKEKAETASMWLVLFFALGVAMIFRYLLMPSLEPNGNHDLLWFGPLALILVIPSLHRLVMPEKFTEHYTTGTWFKAGFLHTFAWLAFTFLLINPPFGDIGSPEPSAAWAIVVEDGENWLLPEYMSNNHIVWTLDSSNDSLNGTAWLMFGLADNADPNDAEISVSITAEGGETTNLTLSTDQWDRISEGRTAAISNQTGVGDVVLTNHASDRLIAVSLGEDFVPGEYSILVQVSEDGDPWKNTDDWTWTFSVALPEDTE